MNQRKMKNRKAFTLIELMTTITILAILLAIFIPNFVRARMKAYHSGCVQNMHNLQTALESYQVDNQSYPNALGNLAAGKQYISLIPDCPSIPGTNYVAGYEVSTDHKAYTVSCPGVHYLQLQGLVRPGFPQISAQRGLESE